MQQWGAPWTAAPSAGPVVSGGDHERLMQARIIWMALVAVPLHLAHARAKRHLIHTANVVTSLSQRQQKRKHLMASLKNIPLAAHVAKLLHSQPFQLALQWEGKH